MKKSDIAQMPEYFDRYINLVEDIEITEALNKYSPLMFQKEKDKLEKIGDKVYVPGKWTINTILQHLIDTERIFNYRALCFARNDKTTLPGFEEDFYADMSNANNRKLSELLEEFNFVRQSSIALFNGFDKDMLQCSGICFNRNVSVLAMGFVLAGHPLHHLNTIKERYYPMLSL